MIIWIERVFALAMHERQLAEHGGSPGIRDENLLDSALARPQQLSAYGDPPPDLADLAASLAFGLARNHPFLDGNKRTAWLLVEILVERSGYEFTIPADEPVDDLVVAVATGDITFDQLVEWFRARLRRR